MSQIALGILGGGQLGSMLANAANKLNIKTVILCDDKEAPAQNFCDEFIFSDYRDKSKIYDFGKKVEVKKEPEVSKFTKQGKPRTKAQMMAAKRIAAGKSISDVKSENEASMRAKAAERFAAFKAKRAAGKMNEDVTPYDIVLEYLLSSKQASTIEEANYVMSEMDAETIQSIVSD